MLVRYISKVITHYTCMYKKSKILLDRSIWVVVDTDKLKPSTTLQYFRLPYILQNDNQNMFIFLLLIWPSLELVKNSLSISRFKGAKGKREAKRG